MKAAAQRDLGLAEADVAAHQAVHRAAGFHVRITPRRWRPAGRAFGLEAEAVGEGFEVMPLEVEAVALAQARGIEVASSSAAVSRTCIAAFFGLLPLAGAEAVQVDRLGVGAGVAVIWCSCATGT